MLCNDTVASQQCYGENALWLLSAVTQACNPFGGEESCMDLSSTSKFAQVCHGSPLKVSRTRCRALLLQFALLLGTPPLAARVYHAGGLRILHRG